MQDLLNSQNQPSKQKLAVFFRVLGQISYWIHLIFGATSAIILGLIIFSLRLGESTNNAAINVSIVFTIASLIALGIRVFFAWRYSRMAKQLQINILQPDRREIIGVLRIGLGISLLGLVLAFLASETTTITIIATAMARPQVATLYEPQQILETADL